MPGRRCAIFGCNNCRASTKATNPEIVYHNFPKEKMICNEWVKCCKRSDKLNPATSQICSTHFKDEDYERDLRNELLGLPVRKNLKKSAVPTVNLPKISSKEISARAKRYLEKEARTQRKEVVNKLIVDEPKDCILATLSEQSFSPSSQTLIRVDQEQFNTCIMSSSNIDQSVGSSEEDIVTRYAKLLESNARLEKEMKILKHKQNLQRRQLQYYKAKQKQNKVKQNLEAENLLKQVLSPNQIAILLKKKKRVNWTTEEMAVAFTLRYFSKKCYIFLRTKLNFPLPGLSTLRKWASKISIKQGILKDVLTFLKVAGEDMSAKEKVVVLCFDEVKVKSTLEYDVAEDQVLGPYTLMQVCMARGLFSNWKQPVYIDFNQKMTKNILMDIITQLHNISYNCVAIVSDCGGSNVGLWRELSVDITKTYFDHPQTENHIYVFADAPHLLKLIRNWLLDTGFVINGNIKINKKPLEALIQLTDTEVNSCYKISEKHLIVEKSKRQNVRVAAELLSRNTAQALLRYKPGEDKKLAEYVGMFIADIDSWFDIFNSHVKTTPDPNFMKAPYGIHLEEQDQHLNKVKELMVYLRAEGKTSLQLFQKGIIMSIESIKMLLIDMKTKFEDIYYITTHKLNQDCLENFFSQLRGRGPNEHPSPLEAIKRIRMIILGKNPGILDAQVNTKERVAEEYLVARVLEQATVSLDLEENEDAHITTHSSCSGSSLSSSGISGSESQMPETTDDALEYIAGFIAKKFRITYPHLGDFTYKTKTDHAYSLPSWVQQLSFGGLIKPSTEFLNTVKKWNKYFETYHKNNKIRKEPLIVKKLALKIKKRERLSFDIIKLFCKLRTIIRMNYLNTKKEIENIEKSQKRKYHTRTPSTDIDRQLSKKMRKIVN